MLTNELRVRVVNYSRKRRVRDIDMLKVYKSREKELRSKRVE